MRSQRKERDHGGAHCDHYGAQTHDPGVEHRLLEGLAFGVFFFDEIKQNDDMADNYADQANHAKETHEAEGGAHDPQCRERANSTIGHRGEHDERFDSVLELKGEGEENCDDGYSEHDNEIAEAVDLLLLFPADLQTIAGWQRLCHLLKTRPDLFHNF